MAKVSNEVRLREAADFYQEFNYKSERPGISLAQLRYLLIGLLTNDGQMATIGKDRCLMMVRYTETQITEHVGV
jgi:hypothetical protein